jgi:hypothetical protein
MSRIKAKTSKNVEKSPAEQGNGPSEVEIAEPTHNGRQIALKEKRALYHRARFCC